LKNNLNKRNEPAGGDHLPSIHQNNQYDPAEAHQNKLNKINNKQKKGTSKKNQNSNDDNMMMNDPYMMNYGGFPDYKTYKE